MANLTITNIDNSNVILKEADFEDAPLTFTGADTYVDGTILARDSVSNKYIAYVNGGVTQDNGIPKAVLTYDVVAAGAGDIPIRAMISGFVRKEGLVIDADGDDTNVDAVVRDLLRDYSIVVINSEELAVLDNQ